MTEATLHTRDYQQQAVEDYLKTIYRLAEKESPVSTTRLAEARGVRASSVTGMVRRLAEKNLVAYKKHYGVSLTPAGEQIALTMLRRHRLLELYLTEELGFDWGDVHDEAEQLEHAVGDLFIARITAVLGNPQFDPHGEPIPGKDGSLPVVDTRPLSSLEPGCRAVISRIEDDTNRELLDYLAGLNLVPGTRLQLIEKAPFNGPLTIEIGRARQIIGRQAAGMIQVIAVTCDDT